MGCSSVDEPLTLMRYHSCGLPQLYEALGGWKSACGRAYNFKAIKGKIYCFLFHCSSFHGMMRADLAVAGKGDSLINK